MWASDVSTEINCRDYYDRGKILLDDLDRGEYQIEFKNLLQLVYGVTTYMLTD